MMNVYTIENETLNERIEKIQEDYKSKLKTLASKEDLGRGLDELIDTYNKFIQGEEEYIKELKDSIKNRERLQERYYLIISRLQNKKTIIEE